MTPALLAKWNATDGSSAREPATSPPAIASHGTVAYHAGTAGYRAGTATYRAGPRPSAAAGTRRPHTTTAAGRITQVSSATTVPPSPRADQAAPKVASA